ncbi:MAG: hypothetical protein JNL21_26340 [Myxococcales bacterium]|nr:hypothetical protein [Myxococcales bacterium]
MVVRRFSARSLLGLAWCASFTALSLWATTSQAQLSDEQASAVFTEGLARFDAGDPRGAAERWERVYAEGPAERSWRVLYNLGLAYEAAGDRPRAVERFEAFVRRVGEQPGQQPPEIEARRQDAVDRANAIRPKLGKLRVAAAASGERVAVRVGDGPPRDAPFDQYVEPGAHRIVMGEGERAVTSTVELAAGEVRDLAARLLPPREAPRVPVRSVPPREPLVHPGILIGGAILTVSSVALPIGLYFHAKSLREDAEAIPRVLPAYQPAVDEYEDFRTGYLASWAVPSVLGAVTLGLLVAEVVDSRNDAAQVSLQVGPQSATLTVELE